jgi:hypothetical protein
LNTSLTLRFAQWTDAEVIETEELRRFRQMARDTVEEIQKDRLFNANLFKTSRGNLLSFSWTAMVILVLIIAILGAALYIVRRNTSIAGAAATRIAAEVPASVAQHINLAALAEHVQRLAPAMAQPDPPLYEAMGRGMDNTYGNSVEVPKTHAMNTAALRSLCLDNLLQQQAKPAINNPFLSDVHTV